MKDTCHCGRSKAIQNTKLNMCEDLNENDLLTFRLPRSRWSLAMTYSSPRPLREREKLLNERSEFSNLGEGYKPNT